MKNTAWVEAKRTNTISVKKICYCNTAFSQLNAPCDCLKQHQFLSWLRFCLLHNLNCKIIWLSRWHVPATQATAGSTTVKPLISLHRNLRMLIREAAKIVDIVEQQNTQKYFVFLGFHHLTRVEQWWEHSPPKNVASVQIPASMPYMYVGWVCCWFSPLLREVFLQILRFSAFLYCSYHYIAFQLWRQHLLSNWNC